MSRNTLPNALRALESQRQWVKEHGETLLGYLEHYSELNPDEEPLYNDQQIADIFHADMEQVALLEFEAGEAYDDELKDEREAELEAF